MTKQTKWVCAQRRLRSAWTSAQSDQSSLSTRRKLGSLAIHWAHSEESVQTVRSLQWAHRPFRWFCQAATHFKMLWRWSPFSLNKPWVSYILYILPTFVIILKISSRTDLDKLTFLTIEPWHDTANKVSVPPAKTQISLGIRPVWSESSLSAWRNLGSLATH